MQTVKLRENCQNELPRPVALQPSARRVRAAFTLIELLVVIAITVILFALLLRPLVESLRLTQSAQVQAAAQDDGRITLERLTRELSSAVYVYDNASHPFTITGKLSPGNQFDKYTNFLDLPVTNANGAPIVEHAYNAKLDIVPARHIGANSLTDPTTGEPIHLKSGNGSATLSNNGLLFPLAPGSTIIRYFIGLKDPSKPYTNSNEGLLAAASTNGDNTYILYVAQVSPYNPAGKAANADGTMVNEKLFAPMHDGNGKAINKPELDDPDFFRYVNLNGATDVNWLDAAHANYPTQATGTPPPDGTPAQHNIRADNWAKLAKPVITAPDIDLLLLPHNPDGSINYDPSGATAPQIPYVAHAGVTYDPILDAAGNKPIPTVNTSVTFRPAVLQADAAANTTTDYSSRGLPSNAVDSGGLPYIPTLYTASSKSWGYPPKLTLYPSGGPTGTTPYYDTAVSYATSAATNNTAVNTGDLFEYYHTGAADTTGTPVFDVTTGTVLTAVATKNYVPLSVNPDTGTINFDTPALPFPANVNATTPYSPYQRFWSVDPKDAGTPSFCPGNQAINNGTLVASYKDPNNGSLPVPGVIDLTNLAADGNGVLTTSGGTNNSPLAKFNMPPTGLQCANAFVVPGSVRIYGPDATQGPNYGNKVLYSEVSPGTPLSFNQYRVDYLNSLLYLYVTTPANDPTQSNKLPESKPDLANNNSPIPADPVQISFDYQANLTATNTGLKPTDLTYNMISSSNPASSLLVKVDYQTRDLIDLNIGVRIYDTSQGRSIIVPASGRVQVNNSNR